MAEGAPAFLTRGSEWEWASSAGLGTAPTTWAQSSFPRPETRFASGHRVHAWRSVSRSRSHIFIFTSAASIELEKAIRVLLRQEAS